MWEFIAFMLFGILTFCVSGVATMVATEKRIIKRGWFENDGRRYRVTRDKD